MHRSQYDKTWSSQGNILAGNLNWYNVKTTMMTVSTNYKCRFRLELKFI